jgi:hypothetical protein
MRLFVGCASKTPQATAWLKAPRNPTANNERESYRERWDPKELAELARRLRYFADALDEQKIGRKKAKE